MLIACADQMHAGGWRRPPAGTDHAAGTFVSWLFLPDQWEQCKQRRAHRAICLMSPWPTCVLLSLHISPFLTHIFPSCYSSIRRSSLFLPNICQSYVFSMLSIMLLFYFWPAPPLVCFHFKLHFHYPSVSAVVSIWSFLNAVSSGNMCLPFLVSLLCQTDSFNSCSSALG